MYPPTTQCHILGSLWLSRFIHFHIVSTTDLVEVNGEYHDQKFLAKTA